MAGMFLTGQHTFMGMAEATILVVAVAVLGSLTVLPATLSALGDRLEKGRIPWLGEWLQTRRDRGPSRTWGWVLDRVLARPAVSALAASALLIALAVPALSLHTSVLGPSQELPHDMAIMKTYVRVQHAFPGGPQPAQVVVSAPDVSEPAVAAQIRALRARGDREPPDPRSGDRRRQPRARRRRGHHAACGRRPERCLAQRAGDAPRAHRAAHGRARRDRERGRKHRRARWTSTTSSAPARRSCSRSCSDWRSCCSCGASGRSSSPPRGSS